MPDASGRSAVPVCTVEADGLGAICPDGGSDSTVVGCVTVVVAVGAAASSASVSAVGATVSLGEAAVDAAGSTCSVGAGSGAG
jgi:hypothetical protein